MLETPRFSIGNHPIGVDVAKNKPDRELGRVGSRADETKGLRMARKIEISGVGSVIFYEIR